MNYIIWTGKLDPIPLDSTERRRLHPYWRHALQQVAAVLMRRRRGVP